MTTYSKASEKPLMFSLFILMFSFSLSVNMLGPLMPSIIGKFGLNFSRGGLIPTFVNIGAAIAFIWGGIASDKFSKSTQITISWALHCIALICFGFAPTYGMLLFIFLFHGLGSRVTELSMNAQVSDLQSERRAFYLGLLHVFGGVGSLIGPLCSQLLSQAGITWDQCFKLAGLASIVVLCFYAGASYRYAKTKNAVAADMKRRRIEDKAGILEVVKDARIWVLYLIMFVFTGHLSGIMTWLPTYMSESLHAPAFYASMALSVYWLGVITGRLTCTHLAARWQEKNLMFVGCLVSGITLTIGIASKSVLLMTLLTGISGIFAGAMLPLLISVACSLHPRNSGGVTSTLLLNAAASWIVFPWLIGVLADTRSFQTAIYIISLTLLGSALLCIAAPSTGNKAVQVNELAA